VSQVAAGWYKVLTGKIGEMNATLHLHTAGEKVSGYLWFAKSPMPMQCYAEYKPLKDSLVISANANPLTVILTGKLTGNDFAGSARLEKENNAAKESTFKLQVDSGHAYSPFDYVYVNGAATMPAKLKNESTAEYFSAVIWPKPLAVKPLEATLKSVINKAFDNKGPLKEPGSILPVKKNSFITSWKNSAAKLTTAEARDMGLSYSQQTEHTVNVMYEDDRIITLADFLFEYTGGAHGNNITSTTNIDKRTGTILKLKDVLTDEGIRILPALLDAVVRQQYTLDKTKTLEENGLFVKAMAPSDNFYIANGSVGFYYAPYQIMAFAYGEPNLFIPASALVKYIKPAYQKL